MVSMIMFFLTFSFMMFEDNITIILGNTRSWKIGSLMSLDKYKIFKLSMNERVNWKEMILNMVFDSE